jgi:hypothetical protein
MGAVGEVATGPNVEMMRSRLGASKHKKIFSGELCKTLLEGIAKTSPTGMLIAHPETTNRT